MLCSEALSAVNSAAEKCARRMSSVSDVGGPVRISASPSARTRSQNELS